jgi:uncharacterized protein
LRGCDARGQTRRHRERFNPHGSLLHRIFMRTGSLLLLILAAMLIPPVVTSYTEVTLVVPAVATSQAMEGMEIEWVGVPSYVTIWAQPGKGRIFVDTFPLTQIDTQGSARLASEAASTMAGVDLGEVDIHVVIRSDSAVIGGPSAGGALAGGMMASLLNLTPDPGVVMTGTINPDGTIGPIGGVLQKAEAAHSVGATMFLVPRGQSISTLSPTNSQRIDVAEYALENWGMEVKEIDDLGDVAKWMLGVEIEPVWGGGEIDLEAYNAVMEGASQDMIEGAEDLLDQAQAAVGSATLSFQEADHVKAYLDDAVRKMDDAEASSSDDMFYQSASYAFQSKINSTYVIYAIDYLNTKRANTVKGIIEEVEGETERALAEVNGTEYSSLTAFGCYAGAEDRAHEAAHGIEEIWSDYYRSSTVSGMLAVLYDTAYVKQRAGSALWWASLCGDFPGELVPNQSVLKDIAQEYVADVDYLVTYAQSISVGMPTIVEVYQSGARRELEEGAYASAILDALSARSYMNAQLELVASLGSSDSEMAQLLSEKIERERDYALSAVASSRDSGVNPILALSHLESGENWVKLAQPVSSPSAAVEYLENALISFKLARLVAELSPTLSQRLGGEGVDRSPPIVKPFDRESVEGGGMGVEEVAVVSAATGLSGLVVGVLVGRRRREKPSYGV